MQKMLGAKNCGKLSIIEQFWFIPMYFPFRVLVKTGFDHRILVKIVLVFLTFVPSDIYQENKKMVENVGEDLVHFYHNYLEDFLLLILKNHCLFFI